MSRIYSLITPSSPVPFDVIHVDALQAVDQSKTTYTIQSQGFYFIHIGAGIPAYQQMSYTLRNGLSTPNVILTHTEPDGECVTSRDDIQFLGDQSLQISSDYPLFSYGFMQTTWSMFRLDDMLSPLIVFRVSRTSNQAFWST